MTRFLLFVFALTAVTTAAQRTAPLLLVLNKDDATLAFVDPSTRAVLGTVPTGESPHEIAVSGDGRLAFVSNYGGRTPGQTLSVIDIAARKEVHRADLGALRRPHGLAAVGGEVYFTAEVNRLIGRYNPAANAVDWLLGTGQDVTHMIIVRPDERTMFTANIGSDSITVIERGTGAPAFSETVVPVGKGPEGMDLSPDGRELWAAHSRDGGVSIIDVGARKVVQTIDLGTKRSNRLKFTPDGKTVLVSDLEAGALIVVDAGQRKAVKRIALGKNPEGILIQPDGARAYVAVNGDNYVSIIDLSSFQEIGRIKTGAGPDGMAWAAAR
jgi:YVTN family beta-propeller protein